MSDIDLPDTAPDVNVATGIHCDVAVGYGKRVAVLLSAEPPAEGTVHVTFLLNFFDELRRLAPVRRGVQ